ncbi:MAG: transporter solute receptor, family [Enterovirga sp.]|nr:transporter solute receptor, family [Enterovirga sp.]
MRRNTMLGLAALLLTLGLGLVVWRAASAPTVLRIAVGPVGSEDARLIAAAGQWLMREHASLRFRAVPTDGESESAKALDDGRADLAVVRTDAGMPEKAQSVAIMHRDAVVLAVPPVRDIRTVSQLRNRTVGIVRMMPANARLLDLLLMHYEVPKDAVRTEFLGGPQDVEEAFRSGRIDAVLAVGTVAGRTVAGTIAAVTAAGGGAAPVFLPVSEVEAIALRSPLHESFDIVRGAFGGSPPRPADTVKTLGVSHRLVAATTLEDGVVSELAKLLFTMRPALARDIDVANRIEAPDLAKGSSLPVHPGAAAYYENEVETFFDRYSDWMYLGIMALSIVGSGFAGLASRSASRRRARTLGLLERLLEIVRHSRGAERMADLDALEHETDEILGVALGQAGSGDLDHHGVSAFTLGLEQARHAISDRREALGRYSPGLAHAAE